MTPIEPKVARVSRRPICVRCAATRHLVFGDGPVVCRDCIRMAGRLAQVSRVASHDDDVREGGW